MTAYEISLASALDIVMMPGVYVNIDDVKEARRIVTQTIIGLTERVSKLEGAAQEAETSQTSVHQQDHHFIVQRAWYGTDEEKGWTDSSPAYHGEPGEVAYQELYREWVEIFGQDEVRVVRRDVLVTETVVEG